MMGQHKGYKQSTEHKSHISEAKKRGGLFNCLICGNIFWRKPFAIKNGDNKFCSRKCYFQWQKGRCKSDIFKNKCKGRIPWNKGKKNIKMSILWSNKDFRERIIKAQIKGARNRPTNLEKRFLDIISSYNLNYKYTGNCSFLIGFKNPDFIHNNKKICIEVGNHYHHDKDYEAYRKEHFRKYGWTCIVFWGDKRNLFYKSDIEIAREIKNVEGLNDQAIL